MRHPESKSSFEKSEFKKDCQKWQQRKIGVSEDPILKHNKKKYKKIPNEKLAPNVPTTNDFVFQNKYAHTSTIQITNHNVNLGTLNIMNASHKQPSDSCSVNLACSDLNLKDLNLKTHLEVPEEFSSSVTSQFKTSDPEMENYLFPVKNVQFRKSSLSDLGENVGPEFIKQGYIFFVVKFLEIL